MVQAICPNGTLRIIQIGGWVNNNIPAHKVWVRNKFGEYIPGLTASKPPHFMTEQERKAPLEMKDITVDVGAVSREEAIEKFGVRIGEPVVPDVTFSYSETTDLMVGMQLCDTATHKVFYDKLEYIYVEISKFNKPLEELDTLYEKWLYALKNLYKLTQRPKELCDKVFDRLFEEAEIAKFTPQEMREYETSKMAYRDIKNSVDTAKREGIAEGMNQKALDIARNMLADGVDINLIMKYSGLTQEQIEKLK